MLVNAALTAGFLLLVLATLWLTKSLVPGDERSFLGQDEYFTPRMKDEGSRPAASSAREPPPCRVHSWHRRVANIRHAQHAGDLCRHSAESSVAPGRRRRREATSQSGCYVNLWNF
jgi:hypothetical protein